MVIIDADVFDELVADAVQVNAEGFTLFGEDGDSAGHGIEFSEPQRDPAGTRAHCIARSGLPGASVAEQDRTAGR